MAGSLLAAPRAAETQQPGKLPRIGWLTSSVVHTRNVDTFREGMRALGYREVSLEFRAAAGRMDRLPALAAELLALNVEVIVTDGGPAAVAAKRATARASSFTANDWSCCARPCLLSTGWRSCGMRAMR